MTGRGGETRGVGSPRSAHRLLVPSESGVTGAMLLDLPACALEVTRVW